MKRIHALGLTLLLMAFSATSALALTANTTYSLQLMTVSSTGQTTAVGSPMQETTNANGVLSFSFSDVPTSGFLMVQITDSNGQTVRQTLVPAPTAGEQMKMGIDAVSNSQTQAALAAMQGGSSNTATLRAMFPLTMVPTGSVTSSDATSIGQAAGTAATTFQNYLNTNGVTATQLSTFQTSMLAAMRSYASATESAASTTSTTTAAGTYGQAQAQLMTAMIQAAQNAGIDPTVVSTAFDQAGQAMVGSSGFGSLSSGTASAIQATFQAGAMQRQLLAEMNNYSSALSTLNTTDQTFSSQMTALQTAMATAQKTFFQNAFGSSTVDQTTIDNALSTMETAMQGAFGTFNTQTTATSTLISSMYDTMATNMNSMMGSGGMGGGMGSMTGSSLQTSLGTTTQNWSTMMVAATLSNLVSSSTTNLTYTPYTDALSQQLTTAGGTVPTAPDLSSVTNTTYQSLLEVQYDLMLVHLIDMQLVANATQNGTVALTQDQLASISATDLANRTAVFNGLSGLSADQMNALTAALTPPQLFLNSQS